MIFLIFQVSFLNQISALRTHILKFIGYREEYSIFFKFKLMRSILFSLCFLLSGCAENFSPDFYKEGDVGGAIVTKRGFILQVREINISGSGKLSDNALGAGVGGISGGVVGSCLGQGKGKTLSTLGGAGLGALAGAYAQKKLSEQKGVEYTVELSDTKELVTVTQGMPAYPVGMEVKVLLPSSGCHQGRARVLPFNQ